MAGKIATSQTKALERVREAKKLLARVEGHLKKGEFGRALMLVEEAQPVIRGLEAHTRNGRDGLIEVTCPTG